MTDSFFRHKREVPQVKIHHNGDITVEGSVEDVDLTPGDLRKKKIRKQLKQDRRIQQQRKPR